MTRKENNKDEEKEKTEELAGRQTSVAGSVPETGAHEEKDPDDEDEEVNEAEVEMSFWGHLEALR